MKVGYRNRRIQKIGTQRKAAIKHLPNDIPPDLLFQRLSELAAFENLDEIPFQEPPLHFHPLREDMAGQFAVTLRALWRIVIEPAGNFESREDGTAREITVTEITVLSVGDYHSK